MKSPGRILQYIWGILIVSIFPLVIQAQSFYDIPLLGEYQIPDSFCFTVSDVCTGHDSIYQASAREDGWFAVRSICTHSAEQEEDIFALQYVDIYDQNGDFQLEVSYHTGLENAIELTNDSLNIYSQTFIICYELESGVLSGYEIPARATVENGLLYDLQKDQFTVGKWEYTLSGGRMNYHKLTRSNEEATQTLVAYDPFSNFLYKPEFGALCGITAAIISIIVMVLRKKNALRNTE